MTFIVQLLFCSSYLLLFIISNASSQVKLDPNFEYPKVRRNESVVDDYHGTKVKDAYRWLEDPDSEETQAFVESQNNITLKYLHSCPVRKQIQDRLTELWNYPKYGLPTRRGNKRYFFMNTGLQNQSVLFVQESDGEPQIFFDPNKLSTDGTVSLSQSSFSKDGKYFAYSTSQSGSDWKTIRVKNVTSGEDLSEVLTEVKFSGISWTHDHLGFFYGRYPNASNTGTETNVNEHQKAYYHRVGTSQESDILVLEFPEHPKWTVGAQVSDDGNYLLCMPGDVIGEDNVYYADLKSILANGGINSVIKLTPLMINTSSTYGYITNDGSVFYFITDNRAPRYKLVGIDLNKPDEKYWSTIIPQHPKDILEDASPIDKDKMVVTWMRDVKSVMELRNLHNGTLIEEFPLEPGTVYSFSGKRNDSDFFFKFNSFTNPGVTYHVDLKESPIQAKVFRDVKLKGFTPSDFVAKQIFYKSKDGTQVPMFIFHKKNLTLDGNAPTLLYGYGGFGESISADFSITYLVFAQNFNGVIAQPNIRGGGEYGKEWWDAGKFEKKQNVFDDFIGAAEYLIQNNYTSPSKLAIQGGSNGGLLVGACVNQRPDLFGAAIPEVGVMDMLRYQKFTIGHAWCGEFGCSDDKNHFENLIKYSPLHNIKLPKNESVQYPAVLVTTADHDDRVVPLHSYKYISELQNTVGRSSRQTHPLLIRIESKAGHGGGKPTSKQIEEITDTYSFLVQALGYKYV